MTKKVNELYPAIGLKNHISHGSFLGQGEINEKHFFAD